VKVRPEILQPVEAFNSTVELEPFLLPPSSQGFPALQGIPNLITKANGLSLEA
jgi:hypothetical protein